MSLQSTVFGAFMLAAWMRERRQHTNPPQPTNVSNSGNRRISFSGFPLIFIALFKIEIIINIYGFSSTTRRRKNRMVSILEFMDDFQSDGILEKYLLGINLMGTTKHLDFTSFLMHSVVSLLATVWK